MLKELVTSRVMYKLISHFCINDEWLHVRAVARLIGEDCGNVGRAVKRLKKCGIVESRESGTVLEYRSIPSDKLEALRTLL